MVSCTSRTNSESVKVAYAQIIVTVLRFHQPSRRLYIVKVPILSYAPFSFLDLVNISPSEISLSRFAILIQSTSPRYGDESSSGFLFGLRSRNAFCKPLASPADRRMVPPVYSVNLCWRMSVIAGAVIVIEADATVPYLSALLRTQSTLTTLATGFRSSAHSGPWTIPIMDIQDHVGPMYSNGFQG